MFIPKRTCYSLRLCWDGLSAVKEGLIICEFVGLFWGRYSCLYVKRKTVSGRDNYITGIRRQIIEMEYFNQLMNHLIYLSPMYLYTVKLCGVFTANVWRCVSGNRKKIFSSYLSRMRYLRNIQWNSWWQIWKPWSCEKSYSDLGSRKGLHHIGLQK